MSHGLRGLLKHEGFTYWFFVGKKGIYYIRITQENIPSFPTKNQQVEDFRVAAGAWGEGFRSAFRVWMKGWDMESD